MKTIVITSQKGGSGKTMLAAHLAVEAERTGGRRWIRSCFPSVLHLLVLPPFGSCRAVFAGKLNKQLMAYL